MPENPEKKLGGFVVETRTSDAAISRRLEGLRREISAVVGEPTDAVFADSLSPENVTTTREAQPLSPTNVTRLPATKLTHKDSATGLYIQLDRDLKKAA